MMRFWWNGFGLFLLLLTSTTTTTTTLLCYGFSLSLRIVDSYPQRRQKHHPYHLHHQSLARLFSSASESSEDRKTHKANLEIAQLASKASLSAATTAHALLNDLKQPDTVGYNSVMKAYAKAQAPNMAQDLLDEMERIYQQQYQDNQEWYERNRQGDLTQDELTQGPPRIRVKPNVRSYTTVMDAWSRKRGASQATRVLERLQERYQQTGDIALKPNIISYNTILSAWAKTRSIEGAETCHDIFNEMILPDTGIEPDVISFNALLNAWARSGAPNAGAIAEHILKIDMKEAAVMPNVRSYATVMDAWSRSQDDNAAERAYALLLELEQDGDDEDLPKPNGFTYATAIHAFAMSRLPNKAHRAHEILQRMPQPNLVAYNSVLNACATSHVGLSSSASTTQTDLPDLVRTLYEQVLELEPDHFTFGTVLKACTNLYWGDGGQAFSLQVFREACERGQVSFGVLFQLRQANPDLYRSLLTRNTGKEVAMSEIPPQWCRNVRELQRPPPPKYPRRFQQSSRYKLNF